MDEFYATDWVGHGFGEDIWDLKNYKQHDSEVYDAFPDIHWTIKDMIAEGDKVAVRYIVSGTHKGEYMEHPPTNKKATMWIIQIYSITGGKFVETWERYDTLGLMQQLGVVPTPQKEK